ncbi:uncharacterized protein LOC101206630 isoform X2 [Cucumis sativus]|uniref:uncharacterized protein LOC101206630 isoform X2 n=1 Tax=Cucumis sativus TaxID=3659 RepID=UPI0005EC8635|nr:uncharacterized protein LOC101206630 isoform X2 [Cucumis sativus]
MSSFNFLVNNMRTLVDAFATLGLADHKGDATFSPEMFCLMADSNVSIHSAIGLQLWPPFFDHYFCRDLKNSWFFFSEIFPLAQYLKDFGYTSFSFSIGRDPHHAQIEFQGPTRLLLEVTLRLVFCHLPLRIHQFDLSVFVSMDSQQFSNLISQYHMFDDVHVTITSERVIFSYSTMQETILSPQCIIGGLRAPDEVEFVITLGPQEVFNHIASQTKRVWFFKQCNSNRGLITAPLGLNARLVAFFCDVFANYRRSK